MPPRSNLLRDDNHPSTARVDRFTVEVDEVSNSFICQVKGVVQNHWTDYSISDFIGIYKSMNEPDFFEIEGSVTWNYEMFFWAGTRKITVPIEIPLEWRLEARYFTWDRGRFICLERTRPIGLSSVQDLISRVSHKPRYRILNY